MTPPLDFLTERDDHTASWQRSDPLHAAIRPLDADEWKVKLPDGDYHRVHLYREHGAWMGYCDCKGFEYNDGPCAHLCALRRAHWCVQHQPTDPAGRDVHGNDIHVPDVEHDDDLAEPADEPRAVADGGRDVVEWQAGGQDGETFGRPEGKL